MEIDDFVYLGGGAWLIRCTSSVKSRREQRYSVVPHSVAIVLSSDNMRERPKSVAVDDSVGVEVVDCVEDLDKVVSGRVFLQQPIEELPSTDELEDHDERVSTVDYTLVHVLDGHNPGVGYSSENGDLVHPTG